MNALKKILNVLLILIGVVLIVVCADLVLNKTVKTDYGSLSDADQEALKQIADVVVLFDDEYGNSDIWNESYNPNDNGCIITRKYGFVKGTSYVINADLSGNVFAQKIDMGEDYENVEVYRLACCTPQTIGMYFSSADNAAVTIDGEELFAMNYTSAVVSADLEQNFVKTSFKQDVQTADYPTADIEVDFNLNSKNIALTGLQYRIIDDLRDASSIEEIKELIAEYVIVREYQLSGTPKLALQQEKAELAEGCPQYVLYSVSSETGNDFTYFDKTSSNSIDFYSAFYYICSGQYSADTQTYFNETGNMYVGAALCEILDEKAIIPNWRELLDSSTEDNFVSQYSLLKAYFETSCGEYSGKSINDIQREYSFEEISSMAAVLIQNDNSKAAAQTSEK